MTINTIAARNETIQKLRARLKTEESAVSILTRAAEQWKERAEAAEARVAGLERERDAACEAVGAIGAAATEAEDRMYGRFRQAEIERDEARAKLARADRLAEAVAEYERSRGTNYAGPNRARMLRELSAYEAGEPAVVHPDTERLERTTRALRFWREIAERVARAVITGTPEEAREAAYAVGDEARKVRKFDAAREAESDG